MPKVATLVRRDWLREKEVRAWQPWLTRYRLQKFIKAKVLKLKIGESNTNCDVWQRLPRGAVRYYRTKKIKELCCGTNGL